MNTIFYLLIFSFVNSLLTERDIASTIIRLPILLDPTENDLNIYGRVNVSLCSYDRPRLGRISILPSYSNTRVINHLSSMKLTRNIGTLKHPSDVNKFGLIKNIFESTDGGFSRSTNDLPTSDYFGFVVAITNNWVIIPSLIEEDGNAGKIYIYKRDGIIWKIFQKINVPGLLAGFNPNDNLLDFISEPGFKTIDIDREHLFIGDINYRNSDLKLVGVVFVYEFKDITDPLHQNQEWILAEKIEGPVPENENSLNKKFGTSYDGFGNYLTIGSEENNIILNENLIENTGAVYIYRKSIFNGWEFIQKLIGPEGIDYNEGEGFNNPKIVYNYLSVGASKYSSESTGYYSGRVYQYILNRAIGNFEYQNYYLDLYDNPNQSINETTSNYYFGYSISITGPWLIIGAPGLVDDTNNSNIIGKVYVYKRNGTRYNFFQELKGSKGHVDDNFGQSISCDHAICSITAPKNTIEGQSITKTITYLFEFTNEQWEEIQLIYHYNPLTLRDFGSRKITNIHYPWFVGGSFTRNNLDVPEIEGSGSAKVFPLRPLILYDTDASEGIDHWCYNVTSNLIPNESAEGHIEIDIYKSSTLNSTLDGLISRKSNNIFSPSTVDTGTTEILCIIALIVVIAGLVISFIALSLIPSTKN